jgi:hypothetical protein
VAIAKDVLIGASSEQETPNVVAVSQVITAQPLASTLRYRGVNH